MKTAIFLTAAALASVASAGNYTCPGLTVTDSDQCVIQGDKNANNFCRADPKCGKTIRFGKSSTDGGDVEDSFLLVPVEREAENEVSPQTTVSDPVEVSLISNGTAFSQTVSRLAKRGRGPPRVTGAMTMSSEKVAVAVREGVSTLNYAVRSDRFRPDWPAEDFDWPGWWHAMQEIGGMCGERTCKKARSIDHQGVRLQFSGHYPNKEVMHAFLNDAMQMFRNEGKYSRSTRDVTEHQTLISLRHRFYTVTHQWPRFISGHLRRHYDSHDQAGDMFATFSLQVIPLSQSPIVNEGPYSCPPIIPFLNNLVGLLPGFGPYLEAGIALACGVHDL